MVKNTLVLGASLNPERYSNRAIKKLKLYGHHVFALGNKYGDVNGIEIQTGFPKFDAIDTVTIYLNPKNQQQYYTYLLELKPKRIIFNPGTENSELQLLAQEKQIETIEACTLVLLSVGAY